MVKESVLRDISHVLRDQWGNLRRDGPRFTSWRPDASAWFLGADGGRGVAPGRVRLTLGTYLPEVAAATLGHRPRRRGAGVGFFASCCVYTCVTAVGGDGKPTAWLDPGAARSPERRELARVLAAALRQFTADYGDRPAIVRNWERDGTLPGNSRSSAASVAASLCAQSGDVRRAMSMLTRARELVKVPPEEIIADNVAKWIEALGE